MSANIQLHTGYGRGEQRTGETTARRAEFVRWLQRALVDGLKSATRNEEVFLLNLIGGALGGLARVRVIEDQLYSDNASLAEDQEVAVLLCEAVYLFERSCARSQSSVSTKIWNKTRGEDLAKIVIDIGLNYLVNPRSFGFRHLQTPYRYFHSHVKEAFEKAQIRVLHGDIKAEVAAAWQNANSARA